MDLADYESIVELEQLLLATRPRRKLTPEEKAHRRRLQYKLHQRRHRAKQKDRTHELESEVCRLAETVARLQMDHRALVESRYVFHSRSTAGGAPGRIALEYLRQFEFGLVPRREREQEQFLRAVMVADVGGPDYEGIDELVEQWRLYRSFFHTTQYLSSGLEVAPMDASTAVVINIVLTLRPRREGVACLYPSLRGDEEAIQELVGNTISVPGRLRFVFNDNGTCSWLGTDMDFVAGLQRALGSLSKVVVCMQNSNISFSTGQISPNCLNDFQRVRRDSRSRRSE